MKLHIKSSRNILLVSLYFGLQCVSLIACKKLIEVDPPINELIGEEIYQTNTGAASVVTGIYTNMSQNGIFTGRNSISLRTGLSSDELVPVTTNNILNYLYANSLTNNGNQLFWSDLYAYIFRINSAIEGISKSNGLTEPVKKQLLGETKFLRAFMYFYLINLYGDVPLLLSTNSKINATAPRMQVVKVYDQIINDLKEAQSLMNEDYTSADIQSSTTDRLRPNKYTATALLSRAYLYTSQWALAEEESSKIISNISMYQLEPLDKTFLKESREAIWQLQSVDATILNTLDARNFILASGNNLSAGPKSDSRPVYISNQLYQSFTSKDKRKTSWLDTVNLNGTIYPYAFKYKSWLNDAPRAEYLVVMRLGEQYLIRAEAKAQLGKLSGANSAIADLNIIRARAGLNDTLITDKLILIDEIYHERQIEFFTEWGHRWLDLKRSSKIDAIMSALAPSKGGTWAPYKALYPIPLSDIKNNPSLQGKQNPGYPEN